MSSSLRDKVIKNTFYHFAAQAFGFLSPFVLTPLIIMHIGQTEFGIYAIVLGFIGTFGLLDFSFSASFIKFISEHYNQGKTEELNKTINTGLFFYIVFTLLICVIVLIFSESILRLINIPADLFELAQFSLYISLIIFFIATSSTIFVSVLISIQKMYLNSIIGLVINIINFVVTYLLLVSGYGLRGILYAQLVAVTVSVFFNIFLAFREVPGIRISPSYFSRITFKTMGSFGLQMQVSRFSTFLSEKYDEFLLGYFTTLGNVTYFNLANRVTRLGKFFPLQLFQQVAPVAAELNAKKEENKLNELFFEATKYLTVFSAPIFLYILIFAELIIDTWMGPGYEITVYLLRFLAIGQLVNLLISAPGNSIIPNLGKPKFLMYEGLINLGVNLVLSFLLIKYYGILGAAIGTSVATIVSSFYLYFTSAAYFKENPLTFIFRSLFKPLIISTILCTVMFGIYFISDKYVNFAQNRITGLVLILVTSGIFFLIYILLLWKSGYLIERDRENMLKLLSLLKPASKRK
jgi:O-antigen/teichoic acid export membrane protein